MVEAQQSIEKSLYSEFDAIVDDIEVSIISDEVHSISENNHAIHTSFSDDNISNNS